MSKLKPIPTFKTEAAEEAFWETHNSTEYINWVQAMKNPTMLNLQSSAKPVTAIHLMNQVLKK